MAKWKRVAPKEPKPAETKSTWTRWKPFLDDWGQLVVPLGIAAIILILRFLGIVEDTGSGFIIGLVVLCGLYAGVAYLIYTNVFPKWVRVATIVLGVLFLMGMVVPFTDTVYPGFVNGGEPAYQTVITRDSGETTIDDNVGSGWYSVEVFAKSLFESGEMRGEGRFKFLLAGKEITGKFTDTMRAVRATRRGGTRQVEQKHLMEVFSVNLPEGTKTIKPVSIDSNIGPELRVSLYPTLLPPFVIYVIVGIALIYAIAIDGLFQEETQKWRLAPLVSMAIAFLFIFRSSYERGSVTSGAIWSAIFGGVVGFLLGWLLSLLGRRVIGHLRTRV